MATDALQVFVLSEGQLLASEVFADGVFSIGSHEGCDLVLRDETIAPVHVKLHYFEGKATLQDQGDAAGTYVNGQRVRESLVTSADDIYLGRYLLKLRRLTRKSPGAQPPGGAVTPAEGLRQVGNAPAAPRERPSSPLMPTPRPGGFGRPLTGTRGATGAAAALQPVHLSTPAAARPSLAPRLSAVPTSVLEPLRDVRDFDEPREITLIPLEPSPAPVQAAAPAPMPVPVPVPVHAAVEWPSMQPAPVRRAPVPIPAQPPAQVPMPAAERAAVKASAVQPAPVRHAAAPVAAPIAPPPLGASSSVHVAAAPLPKAATPTKVQPVPSQKVVVPLPRNGPPVLVPADHRPAEKKAAAGRVAEEERLKVTVRWGRQLVATHAFDPGQEVVAGPQENLAIPLYGFKLTGPTPIARPSKDGWTVHPPRGTQVSVRAADGRWSPLLVEGVVPLAAGAAARVSFGQIQLELAHTRLPARAAGKFRADPVFCAILLVLFVIAAVLVSRKPVATPAEAAVETQRMAQYVAAVHERAKPPKPQEKPPPRRPERVPPKPIAQAETLKAATEQLHVVDRVMTATREIDHVLDALNKVGVTAGSHRRNLVAGLALPSIPNLDHLSAPSGIGDLSGPLTKGLSSLAGGDVLAAGTAGHGAVRGVPVQVPRRPSHVQGEIDRDALARVINAHVDEMRLCYERALLRDANIGAGKLTLEWSIGAAGTVTDIRTKSSTLRSPEVLSCILGVVRGLQFPRPEGGEVIVSYPILFNSVGY